MSETNVFASGLAGLDRKQMEAERLARAARKRGVPDDASRNLHDDGRGKRLKSTLSNGNSDEKAVANGSRERHDVKKSAADAVTSSTEDCSHVGQTVKSPAQAVLPLSSFPPSTSAAIKPIASSTTSALHHPNGTLKRTWAYGHPRANDIKIEEVLQKNTLNTAVISSWQWDFDWLMTKFVQGRTKYVFVMEAKDEAERKLRREEFIGLEKVVRLVFPPMSKSFYSRMHSKLMLLFHDTHLRIVVPSANPTKHDWGESGLLENTIFLVDLPRLSPNPPQPNDTKKIPFRSSLEHFLEAQNFPADVLAGLNNFDFSATQDMHFIHSIPGTYNGNDEVVSTGLPFMAEDIRIMTGMSVGPVPQVEIDYATSSLGAMDNDQAAALEVALMGESPHHGLEKKHKISTSGGDSNKEAIRIIFPSKNTVQRSKGGEDAAGTIFLPSKTYSKSSFPRHLLRDYASSRQGLLSHNKIILTRTTTDAHIYNGSANLSASAWGRLSLAGKSKTSATPKMTVANWECGVLLPLIVSSPTPAVANPTNDDDGTGTSKGQSIDEVPRNTKKDEMAVKQDGNANGVVSLSAVKHILLEKWGMELPFLLPARRYEKNEVAWTQESG